MSNLPDPAPKIQLSDEEKARRSRRSRAIGYGLAALVVLFYLITVFKMGPSILKRSL